jgi:CheY-like chemotaxis protein
VKFTPDGGRVILGARRVRRNEVRLEDGTPGRMFRLPAGEEDEFLEVAVTDTGIGIPDDRFENLFQPFVQVDSSPARRHSGTGLGLAMIRRLAELHGGTVGVSSRAAAGSRFVVWIPYRRTRVTAQEAGRQLPPLVLDKSRAAGPPLALIVEDDDQVADLIDGQLRKQGYTTIRAATAEEGLVRAAKQRPQLVTLDIFLPHADGWEFLRQLKTNPAIADTPVVIVSVSDDLQRGLALGATRVLQKPFTRAELEHALAGLVATDVGSPRQTVLLVDDNPAAADLLAAQLAETGLDVMRAYSGEEAIASIHRNLPDLIVLDLTLPGMSAFEVVQALKQCPETAAIPVLAVTGRELTAAERIQLNGNLLAVLEKADFSGDCLAAEVRRALAGVQTQKEGG